MVGKNTYTDALLEGQILVNCTSSHRAISYYKNRSKETAGCVTYMTVAAALLRGSSTVTMVPPALGHAMVMFPR